MEIGILTYWNSTDNYGQILQCYALQYFLKRQGHNAYLIKYSPTTHQNSIKKLIVIIRKVANNLTIKGIKYHFSKEREENKLKQKEEFNQILKNKQLNKIREFDLFRNTYIKSYPTEYKSISELKKCPPKVDILICGSDQIWHNSYSDSNTSGWFLHFGDKKILRIAYAASIGHKLNTKDLKLFKKLLLPLDAISVREQQVKEYAIKVGYKNTSVVLDPTLLLNKEDYKFTENNTNTACKNALTPYVFIYILNIKTPEDLSYDKIENYCKANNYNIKVVTSSGYCPAREVLPNTPNVYATIPEWLNLLEKAECVITTSFHGMVFSLIMKKKFIVIPLKQEYSASNERMEYLLNKLKLEDRIYNPTLSFTQQMEKPIDWSFVSNQIQILKDESITFLLNSINIQK